MYSSLDYYCIGCTQENIFGKRYLKIDLKVNQYDQKKILVKYWSILKMIKTIKKII